MPELNDRLDVHSISAQDVENFNADGAVCLRGIISDQWLDVLGCGIERGLENPSPFQNIRTRPGHFGRYVTDTWVRHNFDEFRTFCDDSGIAKIAARFLGLDQAQFLFDSWITKYPGTMMRTPWHQDTGIHGSSLIIWIPLDPMNKDTSLEVVRGSHAWGRHYHSERFDDVIAEAKAEGKRAAPGQREPERIPDIDRHRSEYDIISWDVEPGDCLIVNALSVHGAPGNYSTTPVRRYSCRWMEPGALLAPHGDWIAEHLLQLSTGAPKLQGAMEPFDTAMFPVLPAKADA
ncbi:phytanoyl-CoA dioxygenase family protein [uncultured Ruegeria sp.]|uniref:phytanoyl-CoA dioxygenase family protein n=1 Tax=uncultured Ruegeria sp. TaxID=259304 RepID=UPI0026288316|nr:phytanoyl-CoA dioxygenase family protein [uncultured Ruegeria sp.]